MNSYKHHIHPKMSHRENGGGPLAWGPLDNKSHIHLIYQLGYEHFPYEWGCKWSIIQHFPNALDSPRSCFACKPDWMMYVTPHCPPSCSHVAHLKRSLPVCQYFMRFFPMVFPWFFSKMFFPCNFHFTHIAFLRIHEICSVWSCHIETVWLWDVVFFRTTDQYLELAFCFFPSDFHSANVGFGWWGLGPSGLDALMKGVATQGYPNHQPKPLGDAHCLLLNAMMSCEAECFCCRCCCFWWWGVGWCLTRMAEDGWWGWWQCWRRWWQWS